MDAGFALTFLIWTAILIHFSTLWSNNLLVNNNQKKWFLSALIGALVNLLFNLIFIPFYGIYAAAITTLLSEVVVFIFVYIQSDKKTKNFMGVLIALKNLEIRLYNEKNLVNLSLSASMA